MKAKISKKRGYEAPRIEAASFVTENGYAASGRVKSTEVFNDVKIYFGS